MNIFRRTSPRFRLRKTISGYTTASIRERIYSLPSNKVDGPMAGILLYTSAPDSEGTLGGLVSLGQPEQFGRHIDGALEQMQSCASDPLCAEHSSRHEYTLHEAACHACLFIPETSCERGNKYLDRSVLVPTVAREQLAFFPSSFVLISCSFIITQVRLLSVWQSHAPPDCKGVQGV